MSNLNSALDQLRTWAERNKAVLELADALRGVASVDQLVEEANARLTKVNEQLDAASHELVGQRALVAEAKEEADRVVETAAFQASSLASDAADEANRLREQAREQVANMRDEAAFEIKTAREKANASLSKTGERIALAQTTAEELERAVAAKQIELEGLQIAVADTRASIAKLLA